MADREFDYKDIQRRHSEEIAKAARTPYRQVSWVLALLYCTVLIGVATLLRLFSRRRPGTLEHSLGDAYAYVPEMALHKTIELRAFLDVKDSYRGQGLDVGCGDGVVGGVLVREGGLENLHGVDFYAEIGEQCLQRGYAGFRAGDAQALPFDEGTFDYGISICVVEHVPDLDRTLSEVARVLKPGGRFHFTTPSPEFRSSTLGYRVLRALRVQSWATSFQDYKDVECMHYHYLSQQEWQDRLRAAGFPDVQITPIYSRRLLFLYDLMNCQVLCLRFFFADKLSSFFARHPRARSLVSWATATVASGLGDPTAASRDATHFFLSCTRSDTQARP